MTDASIAMTETGLMFYFSHDGAKVLLPLVYPPLSRHNCL